MQTVLVLGGTSDIGVAVAKRCISGGSQKVILAGRDNDALENRAETLRNAGATVDTAFFDATALDSHDALIANIFAEYMDIDLVLLAFGILGDQEAAEKDHDLAVESALTNHVGAVSVGVLVMNRLLVQRHGTLAILSSVAAERPRRSNFVYGSSKAGLDAFAQGLHLAIDGAGPRVMIVRPGFVITKMTAGRKPPPLSTTPEAVADAVFGALRTGKHIIWVPGTLRWVMWLIRKLPLSIFRRLPI